MKELFAEVWVLSNPCPNQLQANSICLLLVQKKCRQTEICTVDIFNLKTVERRVSIRILTFNFPDHI